MSKIHFSDRVNLQRTVLFVLAQTMMKNTAPIAAKRETKHALLSKWSATKHIPNMQTTAQA
jgi:hypothetical protein